MFSFPQIFRSSTADEPQIVSSHLTHFNQMDNSTFLNIFESIPVVDLPRIAEMNPRLADIIEHHYIRGKLRLHEKSIFFLLSTEYDSEPTTFSYANTSQLKLDPENDSIELWHSHNAMLAFKQFGHIFTDITLGLMKFGSQESQQLFKFVDTNCKNATKQVIIVRAKDEEVTKWKYTFDDKTTQVAVNTEFSKSLPINDFFPYMERLFITNITTPFVRHYPHLTKVLITKFENNNRNPNVYEFVRLNPQLRSFDSSMENNLSFVKYLNRMLPNLESLGIYLSPCENSSNIAETNLGVTFKNVKEFTLRTKGEFGEAFGNISFDQLESYILENKFDRVNVTDDLLDLILNNENLKFFKTKQKMTSKQLLRLVRELPELEEISIDWDYGVFDAFEAIFNAKQPKLRRIDVRFFDSSETIDWIIDIIPSTWHHEERGHRGQWSSYSIIRNNETDELEL